MACARGLAGASFAVTGAGTWSPAPETFDHFDPLSIGAFDATVRKIVRAIPVGHPLPRVAGHVVETVTIRRKRAGG